MAVLFLDVINIQENFYFAFASGSSLFIHIIGLSFLYISGVLNA